MRIRSAALLTVAGLVLSTATACGSSDDETADAGTQDLPSTTSSTSSTEPSDGADDPGEWSLGPIEASEEESDDPIDDGEAAPEGDDGLDEVASTGETDTVVDEVELSDEDPCGYVTVGTFAEWAGVDEDVAGTVVLESGTVCGYTTDADRTRMALGIIPLVEGEGFLPDDVDGERVDVDGQPGTWVSEYPVEESSLLVVPLGGSDLVIEVSDRSGMSTAELRAGAIAFAIEAMGA